MEEGLPLDVVIFTVLAEHQIGGLQICEAPNEGNCAQRRQIERGLPKDVKHSLILHVKHLKVLADHTEVEATLEGLLIDNAKLDIFFPSDDWNLLQGEGSLLE